MNKQIRVIFLFFIIFTLFKLPVWGCGPGFPEYIYDPNQILDDYYPLINEVGNTNPEKNPILNNNFEVITPFWGPEYLLPVYLASQNKKLPDSIKVALVKFYNDPYRYPIGGIFGSEYEPEKSIENWMEVRNKYSKLDPIKIDKNSKINEFYINLATDHRFQAATDKLTNLGSRFSKDQLEQWINYQDYMFSEYFELPVVLVKPSSPTFWQKIVLSINRIIKKEDVKNQLPLEIAQENEYQLAAIEYYKENYDEAIKLFRNIYNDKNNVRHDEAALSLGWSYIAMANQKYEIDLKSNDKNADKNYINNLKIAQKYYEKISTDTSLSDVKLEIDKYLDYVLYRTDPVTRMSRASKIILNTSEPSEFIRNLDDYVNLWYKYFYNQISNQKNVPEYKIYSKKIKESGDEFSQFLLAWTAVKSNSIDENIAKFKETQSPLWLILAQRQVSPDDQQWLYIESEINKITIESPFYLTAQYYKLDSKSRDKKMSDAVKKSIDVLILQTENNKQYSSQNLFKSIMYELVDDLAEKQKYSVMNYLNSYSIYFEGISWAPYYRYLNFETSEREFFISNKMKQILATLNIDKLNELLSKEDIFNPKIKQYLRLLLFTKATIENRFDISKNMATILAKNNATISKELTAFIKSTNPEEQKFLGAKFILDYPGVTDTLNDNFDEFLLGGVSEIKSIDNFQRNWEVGYNNAVLENSIKKENKIGEMVDSTVIDFASKNPKYRLVPEALSKLVDFAHFGPGTSGQRAFQLLQANYPGSYWAKQTPYWYE